MEGIVHYELLERNMTVSTERHCQHLRRLEEEIQQTRPGRRHELILHQDNAGRHTANMTKAAIKELDWQILPHSLYSLDLVPSDYHLYNDLREFSSTTTLSSKIGSSNSSPPNRRISSSLGSKTFPDVGRQS
jgi:hypothetical protein